MSDVTTDQATLSSPEQEQCGPPAPEQAAEQAAPQTPEREQDAPPTDSDAQQAAEQAGRATEAAEAEEQAAQQKAAALLKGVVRAYAKGERAYRAGLLEAGRLAHDFVTLRLSRGAKRKAAVQAIEGQLAAYATDTVDANRLVRCWAAWNLLCEQPGLAEAAKDVPYGHYRDCWALLIERQQPDTADECWALLPGLEAECLAAFKASVDGGLDKAACLERSKGLVREHAARQKAAAEKAAAEKAAEEQAARAVASKAAEEAKAAQKAAERAEAEAERAEEQGDDKAAEQARQAAAEARQQAEAKRRADQQAAFAAEQAAREAARAKQEQQAAAKRQAEADARAQREQDKRDAKAARADKPATVKQPGECRAENLLTSCRTGTPDDVGTMLADGVRSNADPVATMYALVADLLDNPPKGMSGGEVLFAMLRAGQDAYPASSPEGIALAAALAAARKPASKPGVNGKQPEQAAA